MRFLPSFAFLPGVTLGLLATSGCVQREFNTPNHKSPLSKSNQTTSAGAPLDVNDVSFLLPAPKTSQEGDAHVWLEKDAVLPRQLFDEVVALYASSASTELDALQSDEAKGVLVPTKTKGLGFRNPQDASPFGAPLELPYFYVAGIRFDFCAPGRHLVPSEADCKVQVRLVAHPLWTSFSTDGSAVPANARRPSDDALHVVYEFGSTAAEKENLSKEIAALLANLKAKSPSPTGGEPLGVHPAFKETLPKDSDWWNAHAKPQISGLLKKGSLVAVAANFLGNATKGWGFVAGVVNKGRWLPVLQKFGAGGPEVAMQRQSVNVEPEFGLVEPVMPPSHRPSIGPFLNDSAEFIRADLAGKSHKFASFPFTKWEAVKSVVDTRATGLLATRQLDVRHSDCVSCHRINTHAFEALNSEGLIPMWSHELAALPALASTAVGTPFLTHEVMKNTSPWNTRAFGHHHEIPSVSLRTLTESMESAKDANTLLGRSSQVWKQCDVKAAWACLFENKAQCIPTHCTPTNP